MRNKPERITGLASSKGEKASPKNRPGDVIAERAVVDLEYGLGELHKLLEKLKRQIWATHFHDEGRTLRLRPRKNFKLVEEQKPKGGEG